MSKGKANTQPAKPEYSETGILLIEKFNKEVHKRYLEGNRRRDRALGINQ